MAKELYILELYNSLDFDLQPQTKMFFKKSLTMYFLLSSTNTLRLKF